MVNLANKVLHPFTEKSLAQKAIKQAAGYALGGIASVAISSLPMIIAGISNQKTQDTITPSEDEYDETTVAETRTDDEIKEDVKTILTNNGVEINKNHIDDIVKKYNAMKTINPDISDAEISRRLTNYAKALERKDQLQQMADADPFDETSLELKVVDTDMTPEVMQNQEKYLKALYNRGEGELSLYDLNGDNEVSEEEYVKVKTNSTTMKLLKSTEGTAALSIANNSFINIDFNGDGKLTANEFGAAQYASYRLYDYVNDNNELTKEAVTKTGNEFSYDEFVGTTAVLTGSSGPKDIETKAFRNSQHGAYNLLKDYKPE